MKIDVFCGCFNPPTLAHKFIMEDAMSIVNSDLGVYVPSSDAYVKRKLKKGKYTFDMLFDFEIRKDMLEAQSGNTDKIVVSRVEENLSASGHTLETLLTLREQYNAEVYFVTGLDNLEFMTKWSTFDRILTEFKIIAFDRGISIRAVFRNELLAKYRDRIILAELDSVASGISSTLARQKVLNNELLDGVCDKRVEDIMMNYVHGSRRHV